MDGTARCKFPTILKKDEVLPFLLMSVGKGAEQSIYRPLGLAQHQFLFSMQGCGETVMGGKKVKVPEGALMYHEPNTEQRYYPITEKWLTEWVTFEQKWPLIGIKSGVYTLGECLEFTALCDKMLAIEQDIFFQENATAILYELIVKVQAALNSGEDDRLYAVIDYIGKNFHRDISLEDISESCMLTKEYLCRLFKSRYHTTVFSYVKKVRIQEAKKLLLLHKERSIAKIAEAVGYSGPNYFITDFKRNEGMTPGEFRKINS